MKRDVSFEFIDYTLPTLRHIKEYYGSGWGLDHIDIRYSGYGINVAIRKGDKVLGEAISEHEVDSHVIDVRELLTQWVENMIKRIHNH